jgi:tetratricopeptide (TPR) repeat protein
MPIGQPSVWTEVVDRRLALEHFARAIELAPDRPEGYRARGKFYKWTGDYHRALADVNHALQLLPDDPSSLCTRAMAYAGLRQFDRALVDLETITGSHPHEAWAHFASGESHMGMGNWPAAVHALTRAVEIRPLWWVPYKRRAAAYFNAGQCAEALADVRKALELRPTDTSTLHFPLLWCSPALVAECPDESFREGLLELAAKAVEKSPNPVGALQSRAALYLRLGDRKKGQADLAKAVKSETANHYVHYQHALLGLMLNEAPKYRNACAAMVGKFGEIDDPMAANFIGWTCALASDAVDDYEPVLASATKAVEAQPDSEKFLNTLGAILYRSGRHDEAIERLTELDHRRETAVTVESYPTYTTVQLSPAYTWYFLAMAHHKAGNAEQAREYLNKANQWTDKVLADGQNPPRWNRRATLELLRTEAEALLGTDDEESAENGQEPDRESNTTPQVEQNQQRE